MQLWMYEAQKRNDLHPLPVSMTLRSHLFSYRTQKLSSVVQKVLGWTRPGRICRCRFPKEKHTQTSVFFFSTTDTWCLHGQIAVSSQKKNLQIADKTISATLLLFVRVEYARQENRRCVYFFCLKWFEMANLILVGNLQKGALDRKRRHQKNVLENIRFLTAFWGMHDCAWIIFDFLMTSKMAKCDADTSLEGYVDASFQKKTHSFECVFSFLQRILGVWTVKLPCPAKKRTCKLLRWA